MFWIDSHRRLRERLSDYIDGELHAAAAGRLEAHLAECARCREELAQLRATVTALRDLPEAEAPRSFALAPEQVAEPRRAAPTPAPLVFGARIAAAGVAAALAAVLVIDLGGYAGNGSTDEAAAPVMITQSGVEEREMGDSDAARAGQMYGGSPEPTPAAGEAAPSEPNAEDSGADVAPPEAAGTPAAGEGADSTLKIGGAAETPAAAPEEREAPAEAAEDADGAAAPDGDGMDALTVAEIALAAALGVLVAGSFVLAFAGRKR